MLKNIIRLEHVIGNKTYHLLCDNDSPLNEVKESLFQFLKYVGQLEDQARSQNPVAQIEGEPKVEQSADETAPAQ